jgi:hypothetical protein
VTRKPLDVVAEGGSFAVWCSIIFCEAGRFRVLTKSAILCWCGSRSGGPVAAITSSRGPPAVLSDAVVHGFAALLKSYRVSRVTGYRYAGEFPRELFRKHGIA